MSEQRAIRRVQNILSTFSPSCSSSVSSYPTAESKGSFFSHVKMAPLDPILGTNIIFNKDPDNRKINLGIGAYRTDEGKPLVLNVVRKAERLLAQDNTRNMEYLPQQGDGNFTRVARELLFGEKSSSLSRIASVQSLSGTGSLRLAGAFIKTFYPSSTVYYSSPTWGNHQTILQHCSIPGKAYRYWNDKEKRLDLKGMIDDLAAAPERSIILLHACAHNPTGVDPTNEQWKEIMKVIRDKNHLTWFDSAYQGFASGCLDRDAWAIRHYVENGLEMLVSQSFAKNFGLYGERIGGLHVVCSDSKKVDEVISQLNVLIRPLYSNPPRHGAEIVYTVLSNPELYSEWRVELKAMADRINKMRTLLFDELKKLGTPGDWSHIKSQIGMFSFTGLTTGQCESLIKNHHIYLLTSGRISMAGINTKNVLYLAKCIDDVVRNVKN